MGVSLGSLCALPNDLFYGDFNLRINTELTKLLELSLRIRKEEQRTKHKEWHSSKGKFTIIFLSIK